MRHTTMIRRFFAFIKRWLQRALLIGLLALIVYLCYQPDVAPLRTTNPTTSAMMELRKEQSHLSSTPYHTRMIWKNIDAISPNLVHAVILAEDDTFYQHHGFDLEQIQEAVKINWQKKRWAYGGSTITQQLARNLYLTPRKNLARKLKEAIITVRLERELPKKRILEIYLNVVEWGRGIFGAEAAAQFYYNKPAIDLTPDEAASLASILPSPRRWSPSSEKAFMARRRTNLLDRMRRAGYVPTFTDYFPDTSFESDASTTTATLNPDELQGNMDHVAPD